VALRRWCRKVVVMLFSRLLRGHIREVDVIADPPVFLLFLLLQEDHGNADRLLFDELRRQVCLLDELLQTTDEVFGIVPWILAHDVIAAIHLHVVRLSSSGHHMPS
jgi:hypothetical protein